MVRDDPSQVVRQVIDLFIDYNLSILSLSLSIPTIQFSADDDDVGSVNNTAQVGTSTVMSFSSLW